MRLFLSIFLLLKILGFTIMSKDTSSSSTNDHVIQTMQQQFERMFNMMAGVHERLERYDGILNQLQGELRQRRRPPVN